VKFRACRTASGILSFGSFYGNMLNSAFGASIAASMANRVGVRRDIVGQDRHRHLPVAHEVATASSPPCWRWASMDG